MRSYSAREMVCFVALVESSTMKVDLVLRESTLALTTTLPNSVTWLLGIFSVNSRSRPAAGLNSTCAALTSYTTAAPPRWRKRRERSACGVAPVRAAQSAPGRAGLIWGVYPGAAGVKYPRGYQSVPPLTAVPASDRPARQSDVTGNIAGDDAGPRSRSCPPVWRGRATGQARGSGRARAL